MVISLIVKSFLICIFSVALFLTKFDEQNMFKNKNVFLLLKYSLLLFLILGVYFNIKEIIIIKN